MADDGENSVDNRTTEDNKPEKMFTLKKWNAVAMWSWDVECDICAICRVQVMEDGHIPINIHTFQSIYSGTQLCSTSNYC
ncbi:hypothetical protein ACLKA7_014074 [Drosophila subpalustris]